MGWCFSALKDIESLAGLQSFVYDSRLAPVSIVPFVLWNLCIVVAYLVNSAQCRPWKG
jgi:hypothetical protein